MILIIQFFVVLFTEWDVYFHIWLHGNEFCFPCILWIPTFVEHCATYKDTESSASYSDYNYSPGRMNVTAVHVHLEQLFQ